MLHYRKKTLRAIRGGLLRRKLAGSSSPYARVDRLVFEPLEPRLVLDAGPLVISEFLTINDSIVQDADGDYPDWIEIHNPTQAEVDLDGWHLTDDADDLTKWEFPAVSIAPDDYLLVFASNKDRTTGPELHTNFKLSSAGEYLGLIRPDGTTVSHAYAPQFPQQFPDMSYGLTRDITSLVPARAQLTYLVPESTHAGLGTSWTHDDFDDLGWVGSDPPPPLLITEAGTGDPDFVEVQNVSEHSVDTSGWVVVVNNADDREHLPDINAWHSTFWNLPDSMAPGEVRHGSDIDDGSGSGSYWEDNIFWRTGGPGWALMLDGSGNVADFVVWGYSAAEIASFDVTINGHHVTAETIWNGDAVPPNTASTYSLQRVGSAEHDHASDWDRVTPVSMGAENTDLEVPFPSGPMTGVGFSADPLGYGGAIQTDVEAAMRYVNASLWMRIPFDVDADLAALDSLRLWMKYEDGFVAYLNGQEIAGRNAPASPPWNSAALSDRPDQDAALFEDIDVSAHLGLLQPGRNMLAIHGLNDSAANGEFLILPRLVATSTEVVPRYMAVPTPREPNEAATTGAGPEFSQAGGTFTDPFAVELTTATPEGLIRYTIDGTVPTEASTVYSGPIVVDTSMQVRARVFQMDLDPSPVVSHSYLLLAADLHNFSSQLPLLVVDTFGRSIGSNTYQPGYMAIFEPVDDHNPSIRDRSALTNPEDLDTRIGIKTRGSSSGGWPKHHYRLEAWGEVNEEDKDISPLGLPKESDWILGSFYTFDRALMRNPLAYELSNQVGRWAARTRYVEVFVNTGSGPLSYADYLGVYAFMETNKRDEDRVDVEELEPIPEHNTEPGVTGGYILKIDRRDPGDSGFSVDGLPYNYVEPKEVELETPQRAAQRSYITNYIRDFHSATYGPNYADPELGFRAYIDVESWIDHSWLNILPMNVDAYRLSGYMYKDRNGLLEGGPIWDFDRSMESTDGRDDRYDVWDPTTGDGGTKYFTYGWWDRLFLDPDFGQRWIDRWFELRQDEFSTQNIHGIIDSYKDEIGQEAVDRNFAKWPEVSPRGGSWTWEINNLKNWLANRASWIEGHFLVAPALNQNGGLIDPGFELTMSAPVGPIYYTLDGTDPRAPGGGVSPAASVYTPGGTIPLNDSTTVIARAWNNVDLNFTASGPVGGWSAPTEAQFYVENPASAGNLVISELNYNPYDPTPEELAVDDTFDNNDFEFVEFRNTSQRTIFLGAVEFADGVEFAFPDHVLNTLRSGESVVVVNNAAAFQARYGTGVVPAGEYDGKLKNEGERIAILDRFGDPIADFAYDDRGAWPGRADGKGAALELIDPAAVPSSEPLRTEYLQDGDHWRSSSEYGGTPGSPGTGPIGDVFVNEVLTRTPPGVALDTIELYNPTAEDVDIGGWYLSDDWGWDPTGVNGNYRKFRVPDDTTIAALGYVVFDEDDFNPGQDTLPTDFALNGIEGDDVWLMAADAAGKLTRFVDHAEFGAAAEGESWGRWPDDAGDFHFYPMISPTLDKEHPENGANSGPRLGQVILSEVNYHPAVGQPDNDLEFVEIYNSTNETVDLTNWRIRKGIDFDFLESTLLQPHGTLVVVPFDLTEADKLTAFNDFYGITEPIQITGGYTGQLDNGGDRVQLQRPGDPPDGQPDVIPYLLEDEAIYDDEAPWPTQADGGGQSLNRAERDTWGDTHLSWDPLPPSPGVVTIVEPWVAGRHVFYNNSTFDGENPAPTEEDDAAIAPDKAALLPGQTATFANYTSYGRGINGVMVDVGDLIDYLPEGVLPGIDDFQFRVGNSDVPTGWAAAPDPSVITVRPGAGVDGSDRVTIIWSDNAIQKQWLQVTVLDTQNTGLSEPDVFYFGNAIGESGNSTTDAKVNATDMLAARNHQRTFINPAPIDFDYDYDRDARVNATDMLIARNNQTNFITALQLISVPPSKNAGEAAAEIAELPAHDAVLEQSAGGPSGGRETPSGKLNWLYEFEQIHTPQRPSPQDNTAGKVLDKLLADDWR